MLGLGLKSSSRALLKHSRPSVCTHAVGFGKPATKDVRGKDAPVGESLL